MPLAAAAIVVALALLSGYLANVLSEGTKYCISFAIRKYNKGLDELCATVEQQVRDLHASLKQAERGRLQLTSWPSDWLRNLEKCTYDLEDIEQSMKDKGQKKAVRAFVGKTRELVEQLQELAHHNNLDLAPLQEADPSAVPFLREEEKNIIIEDLMKESVPRGVSITGICSSGKTTLATAIVADPRIRNHFPCILNPCQASGFDTETMLGLIREKLQPPPGERVLIQLDDLPALDANDWSRFNSVFRTLENGSRFIITTQAPKVALLTGTSQHFMQPLAEDAVIDFIRGRADANVNLTLDDNRAIENNKADLVSACSGLPFLANRVGLLLSAAGTGQRLDAIRKLTNNCCWKVADLARVLANLKPVSVLEEKPYLRRCLAYFSLFPQDHGFKERKLARLWMAEGFTQLSRQSTDADFLYEQTKQFFEDLESCSLFQGPDGNEPRYRMHKLAYDLAQHVAPGSFCRRHIGNSNSTHSSTAIPKFARHFSLCCHENIGDDEKKDIASLLTFIQKECKHLRTFLLYRDSGGKIPRDFKFFRGLTRLRVLDLSHTKLSSLKAKDVSQLRYLCYLDLSYTAIKTLPTLPKSTSLQVLKLKHCTKLVKLPTNFGKKMTNLVYLHANTRGLGILPQFLGMLGKLQVLDVFTVGKQDGYKITELRGLNGLEKSLCIARLENVQSKIEAEKAMLSQKEKLDRLELMWTSTPEDKWKSLGEEILEGLQPHKNLQELIVRNYYGPAFPHWLNDVCVLLRSIHLDGCRVVPSLVALQSLRKLEVRKCDALGELDGQLPQSLTHLIIKDCGQLSEEVRARLISRMINVTIRHTDQTQAPTGLVQG